MFRRGTGLRRSLVVSTLGLVWGALLVASPAPSAADDYEPYLYDCKRGASSVGRVSVTVAVPGPVYATRPLVVKWKLGPLKVESPGDFPKGGHFLATATSRIAGLWEENNQTYLTLPSVGRRDLSVIKAADQIEIPQDLSGQVEAPKDGTADIVPGNISVDFAPAERLINDKDVYLPPADKLHVVQFEPSSAGGWTQEGREQEKEPEDRAYGNDTHETKARGATATVEFIGTGIEYFGERAKDMGVVDVSLETQVEPKPPVITGIVNASLYNGQPITGGTVYAKQSLWSKTNLPYGKHVLTLKNASDNAMRVDAFKVYSSTVAVDEPSPYRVVCSPADGTVIRTLKVKVEKLPASVTPSPTVTVTKTPTPGVTYTTTPPASTATPKPTLTVTATVTPTRPTPTAPQVFVTPTGGAQTGEAPDEGRPSGMGLISGGTAMLLGSVFGGVALKRRRAAHVRGRR